MGTVLLVAEVPAGCWSHRSISPAVTYTTLGYGDLVLPKEWRMIGPVEGLTGILMCGLSTGIFLRGGEQIVFSQVRSRGEREP